MAPQDLAKQVHQLEADVITLANQCHSIEREALSNHLVILARRIHPRFGKTASPLEWERMLARQQQIEDYIRNPKGVRPPP